MQGKEAHAKRRERPSARWARPNPGRGSPPAPTTFGRRRGVAGAPASGVTRPPCTVGEGGRAPPNALSSAVSYGVDCPFRRARVPSARPSVGQAGGPGERNPLGKVPCRGLMKPRHGPLSKVIPRPGVGVGGPGQYQYAPSGPAAGGCVPRNGTRKGVARKPGVLGQFGPLVSYTTRGIRIRGKKLGVGGWDRAG